MSKVVRIDEESYEVLQENAKGFEPVWRAMRRALGLELPENHVSLSEFEALRPKQEEQDG